MAAPEGLFTRAIFAAILTAISLRRKIARVHGRRFLKFKSPRYRRCFEHVQISLLFSSENCQNMYQGYPQGKFVSVFFVIPQWPETGVKARNLKSIFWKMFAICEILHISLDSGHNTTFFVLCTMYA